MYPTSIPRRSALWTMILIGSSGCMGTVHDDSTPEPDLTKLVSVSGVVTLNGLPLAGAVVTFLPQQWGSGLGETDARGRYTLAYAGHPGIPPDKYKVAVSLLVSDAGEPQGIGPRSSLAKPPGMMTAKEVLPPEFADLGRTRLLAQVNSDGGTFNFDIKAPGLTVPPRPAGDAKPGGPPGKASPTDEKSTPPG